MRISVSASATKTLDDVLAAVKDLGAGIETLTNVLDISGSIPSVPGVPSVAIPVSL